MRFKGISHTHSTYSFDGTLSLAELKTLLQAAGYHFALMSEHVEGLSTARFAEFLDECASLSDERFLFVPGLEFHRECLAVNGLTRPLEMEAPRGRLLQTCLGQGRFNVLVHPSAGRPSIFMPFAESVHAVEVWNCKYDGARALSARNLRAWRQLSRSARRTPVFGIDFHHRAQLVPVYMGVDVERLSTESVLGALGAGRHTLHHGAVTIEVGSLSTTAMLAIHAHTWLRTLAEGPYRRVKPLLPGGLTRRLRAWINGRADD
jgi:hypothetical protein